MGLSSRFSLHKKESEIDEGVRNHLALVRSTLRSFFELVSAVAIDDSVGIETHLNAVMSEEAKADALHRALSQKIAEGAFFGGVREDILSLLEVDDSIADRAKDAARLLTIGRINQPHGLTILRSDNMSAFLTALIDAVDALSKLLDALRIDRKTALSRVSTVEEYEELADTKKDMLLREVFRLSQEMDAISVIQLRDFIFAADDIADNAENASDRVLILLAKGYA
jgi:predicted phosphate transport protein (TIGR00153 family)